MRCKRAAVIATIVGCGLARLANAQDEPILTAARPGEAWITRPTISAPPPQRAGSSVRPFVADATQPTPPGDLVAQSSGLFLISASWSPAADPDSDIDYYAVAIGTGITPNTEADIQWWQSIGLQTKVKVNLALTEGATYYFSVKAYNRAGLPSAAVHSDPLVAMPATYGAAGNQLTYVLSPTGIDATGAPTTSWPPAKAAELASFLDKMFPVLRDMYGPPSSSYAVAFVRDLRYTASAVFFPSLDEIHMGDTATYQLVTHEMVHAWRRDRLLASDFLWRFEVTLSGFEEGFAQAVSYDAMTEYARQYPAELSQKIYQSSNEWDYDFQNVPELRTRDFWSDAGGTLLHWVRYEMAAAAFEKIQRQHPSFYRRFNAEFYARLNADPHLISSRGLIKDIIASVAPAIEGRPAADWIDAQYVFDCADHPGRKIFVFTQHYPSTEYFIFNRTYFYETFANGSDWAYPDGSGGYIYYHSNGSPGTATLRTNGGTTVWQASLLITPVDNPPMYFGFGNDYADLTTQSSNFPWPGDSEDPTRLATSLLSLSLYRLTFQFTADATTVTQNHYRVVGEALRNTTGVFGGVTGSNGGTIVLKHRNHAADPPASLVDGAFWTTASWASLDHPATNSVDTDPGIIDVTYTDATGRVYTDIRVIGYGSSKGNQAFLFDVGRMTALTPFSDANLSASAIRAVHVTELRQRINLARARFGLGAYTWTDPSLAPGASSIQAQHITELRLALSEAYAAAGRTPPMYTDPTITGRITPVKAGHLLELRDAVVALE